MGKQYNLGKVKGDNATINGVNALTIEAGSGINLTQSGSVMSISSTVSVPAADATIDSQSTNYVQNAAVATALAGKETKVSGVSGKILTANGTDAGIAVSNVSIDTNVTNSDATVPTGAAVTTALNGKETKVSGTAGNLLTANGANAGIAVSSVSVSTSVSNNDTTVPTGAAVTTAISGKADKPSGTAGSILTAAGTGDNSGISVSNVSISTSVSDDDTSIPTGKAVTSAISNISINGGSVIVDNSLSDSSEHPLQNKVINAALNNKQDKINGTAGKIITVATEGNGIAASNISVSTSLSNDNITVPTGAAVTTALSNKANSSDLSNKVDISTFNSALNTKANSSDVTSSLVNKQDKISGTAGNIAVVASEGSGITASSVAISETIEDSNNSIPTGAAIKSALDEVAANGGSGDSGSTNIEIYAFKVDQTESNPASMITYPGDCTNATYTPAHMDYENDVFDYGDWKNAFFIKNIKTVLIDPYTGNIKRELSNDDTIKDKSSGENVWIDATGGSQSNEDNQTMVGIPTVWIKLEKDSEDKFTYYISNQQVDYNYHAYAHTNLRGNIIPYLYLGAYHSSRSYTGEFAVSKYDELASSGNLDYWYPANAGAGQAFITDPQSGSFDSRIWRGINFAEYSLINLLLLLIGRNANIESVFGVGHPSNQKTGWLHDKGLFYGKNTSGESVKVFGIEDFYGTGSYPISGLATVGGHIYYKFTEDGSDGKTRTDEYAYTGTSIPDVYHWDPSYFIDAGTVESVDYSYQVIKMKALEAGIIPILMNDSIGSDSTYWCAHSTFFINNDDGPWDPENPFIYYASGNYPGSLSFDGNQSHADRYHFLLSYAPIS